MARTSKYSTEQKNNKNTEWSIAIYIRLSREDGNAESYSVTNQKDFLIDYVENVISGFATYELYVDDGYTGTDIDREHFQRLLSDMDKGKINCILVKDLSRLSRDYLESGNFLEKEFVQKNIRFISVGEDIDSYLNPDSVNSLIVRFTNLINDDFCHRTSHKIRTILDFKKRKGLFVGAFAAYGYKKSENDKYKLVVDEEAAAVVYDIYDMFVNRGMSKNRIARELTDKGILNPTHYKNSQGLKFKTPHSKINTYAWSSRTIASILQNQVYTGDMVQGKTRLKSYKIHKPVAIGKDEWIIVENTHEPIIDKATFAKAQELQRRDTRTAPGEKSLYLFAGLLRCNDCQRAMKRRKDRTQNVSYCCRTYKDLGKHHCVSHIISEKKLKEAVLMAIKRQIALAVQYESVINKINSAPIIKKHSKEIHKRIEKANGQLEKFLILKEGLYTDWKAGDISKEEYQNYKKTYDEKIEDYRAIIKNLSDERDKISEGISKSNPFITTFTKHKNIDDIDREILIDLIDYILITATADIIIRFKFNDELERLNLFIKDGKPIQSVEIAL